MDWGMSKSQRHIREAFLFLLNQMPFPQITVKDIAEKSELGRSTFYLHYNDKYELLEEIENEIINGFLDIMLTVRKRGRKDFLNGISTGNYSSYIDYFKYIRANSKAFSVLLDYGSGTNFALKFTKAIEDTRLETTRAWDKIDRFTRDYALLPYRESLLSAVYVSLITTWLKRGMDFSEEQMGRLLTQTWGIIVLANDVFNPKSLME